MIGALAFNFQGNGIDIIRIQLYLTSFDVDMNVPSSEESPRISDKMANSTDIVMLLGCYDNHNHHGTNMSRDGTTRGGVVRGGVNRGGVSRGGRGHRQPRIAAAIQP